MSQEVTVRIHPPEGHRSMPHSPLPSLRVEELTKCYEAAQTRLEIGLRLEKCFSDNCLYPGSAGSRGTSSKSDGDIASNTGEEEVNDDSAEAEVEDRGKMTSVKAVGGGSVQMTPDGLILPKRLHNPCVESQDRQRLHRELMLNQKIGRNVLNQKSELQKAMEKHRENQSRREVEASKQENMTPFERVIEQRAKRLEILEKDLPEKDISPKEPEFLQIHAKLRARMDAK
ncbi:uncharacterized protein LOC106671915 [Cimex lectularius]|uniref:Protein FAM107B n=1 Tax=Cimex lectularius TaxID=79782 RepID=A0A8I6SCZ4_CIMLE|nr:uncharacterized protein LOC106671915 [Cimex lectularius]